jgi:signal transduction histidine kinase
MEMSANITQVRELESQLTSLGLMISSVSHGLKGLLTGLAGGIYFLNTGLKKDDNERIERGMDTIQRNVDRIRSMVTDILYYAKKRELNWETVSAKDLVGEICSLLEFRAKEYDVKIETEVKTKDVEFEADIQAIRSMLVNLVENSIDACRLDKKSIDHKVSLKVQDSPAHIEFEVADNGVGMEREAMEKAFTLFFSSKGTEGTGLGLYIANRIATSHGGSIELQSESGVGTKFTVKLLRKRPPGKQLKNSRSGNGGF